jgi:hypothetical protein
LRDAADPIDRQTIPSAPSLAIVLKNIRGRIQRQSSARRQKAKQHRPRRHRAPNPAPHPVKFEAKSPQVPGTQTYHTFISAGIRETCWAIIAESMLYFANPGTISFTILPSLLQFPQQL